MKNIKLSIIFFFLFLIIFSLNLNFIHAESIASNNQTFFVKNKIISNCMNIKYPGNYVLEKDIFSSDLICLNLSKNNILIDCKGHKIIGNNKGYFLYFYNNFTFNKANITLKDCIIKNWIDEKDFIPLIINYTKENKTKKIIKGTEFNLNLNVTCLMNCNNLAIQLILPDKTINSYNISLKPNETGIFNLKGIIKKQINSSFLISIYGISKNKKNIQIIKKEEEILFLPVDSLNNSQENLTQKKAYNPPSNFLYPQLISLIKTILWFLFIFVLILIVLIIIFFSFKKIRKKFLK